MITGNKENQNFGTSDIRDDYDTPIEAWILLMKNLKEVPKKIWSPFYNQGNLKKHLKTLKIKIIHKNKDFFKFEPKEYDCIIDNPPFSIKKLVIERCKKLGKPFCLLLPLDTLERKFFNNIFRNDQKLQIIIPNTRYNFTGYDNNGNVPFKSIWVCYNMPLLSKNQILFEESNLKTN